MNSSYHHCCGATEAPSRESNEIEDPRPEKNVHIPELVLKSLEADKLLGAHLRALSIEHVWGVGKHFLVRTLNTVVVYPLNHFLSVPYGTVNCSHKSLEHTHLHDRNSVAVGHLPISLSPSPKPPHPTPPPHQPPFHALILRITIVNDSRERNLDGSSFCASPISLSILSPGFTDVVTNGKISFLKAE